MGASSLDQLKNQAQGLILYFRALITKPDQERVFKISRKGMIHYCCNIGQQINLKLQGKTLNHYESTR